MKGLTQVENLELQGIIAPVIRDQADILKRRRVGLYNQTTGEVTGYTSADKALSGVLATAKIAFDVAPGTRPKEVFCQTPDCGQRVHVAKVGRSRTYCNDCKKARQNALKRKAPCAVCKRRHTVDCPPPPEHLGTVTIKWRPRVQGAEDGRWYVYIRKKGAPNQLIPVPDASTKADRAKAEAFAEPHRAAMAAARRAAA